MPADDPSAPDTADEDTGALPFEDEGIPTTVTLEELKTTLSFVAELEKATLMEERSSFTLFGRRNIAA